MSPAKKLKYGEVSYWDLLHIATILARMPFALIWAYTKNALLRRGDFKRATGRHMARWFNERYTVPELQYLLPRSLERYKTWAQDHNLPITVDELVDDAHLVWIGPKRNDKVVLYIPGGAYFAPLLDYPLSFWHYVQKELLKRDCDVGFAVLAYSLVPEASFPIQLRQAILAIEHLTSTSLHPKNLHLVGDSAGGTLILSLFSHILHPLYGLRPMTPLATPIRGAYLMSPWLRLRRAASSPFPLGAPEDIVSKLSAEDYNSRFLAGIPPAQLPYADPGSAPEAWFDGLDGVVGRMLMTAGEKELAADDIIDFSKRLEKTKSDFTFVVQENGIHDDPMFDFSLKLPLDQLGTLTPKIINWLAEGIRLTD